MPLLLVFLIPSSIPRFDRLRICRVPGSFPFVASSQNLGPVLHVALPLQLASAFLVFRMPLPSPRVRSRASRFLRSSLDSTHDHLSETNRREHRTLMCIRPRSTLLARPRVDNLKEAVR